MFLCVDSAQYTRTAAVHWCHGYWSDVRVYVVRTYVWVWTCVSMCMTARRWMNSLHSSMWFCLWTVFSSTIRAHKQSFGCFFFSSFEFEFKCVSVQLPFIHGAYYQFSRLERNNRDNDIYIYIYTFTWCIECFDSKKKRSKRNDDFIRFNGTVYTYWMLVNHKRFCANRYRCWLLFVPLFRCQ